MDNNIRFCESCRAVIGLFAVFCEACGFRQTQTPARTQKMLDPMSAAAPKPASQESADATVEAPSLLEVDPRIYVREMYRAEIRLLQSARDGSTRLLEQLGEFGDRLHKAESRATPRERRGDLNALSDFLSEIEHCWEEIQRGYNRDSERLEEEADEKMASLDVDAFLTPDEQTEVAEAHGELDRALSSVATALDESGRALLAARRRAESRFLGVEAETPKAVMVLSGLVLVLLLGSSWWIAGRTGLGLSEVLVMQGPTILGLLVLAILLGRAR